MKCLLQYQWVKLPRANLPQGKGLMGYWAKLASRAAFRKGKATYCGYQNEVTPGMWAGGIVGVKSILGVRSRSQALTVLEELSGLGYLQYTLDAKTKKLTYRIHDWVLKCSGAACMDGSVYTTEGYGFLCLPRNITQRLADAGFTFQESDAWLDLWCHTVWKDRGNAFSMLGPVIQFERRRSVLTLEVLGRRWKWEKTKVWRFLRKYQDTFKLHRLPGSYGCLIYNSKYPTGTETLQPSQEDVVSILEKIRIFSENKHFKGTDHERLSKMVADFPWKNEELLIVRKKVCLYRAPKSRIALFPSIIRAYLSLHCKNCRNCSYDCRGTIYGISSEKLKEIRGPCRLPDNHKNTSAKRYLFYRKAKYP